MSDYIIILRNAGNFIKVKVIIGTIRISEVGTILEMMGIEVNLIEVIEETLRIKTDHIIEVEMG